MANVRLSKELMRNCNFPCEKDNIVSGLQWGHIIEKHNGKAAGILLLGLLLLPHELLSLIFPLSMQTIYVSGLDITHQPLTFTLTLLVE